MMAIILLSKIIAFICHPPHSYNIQLTMTFHRTKQLMFLSIAGCLLAMFASCVNQNESSINAKNLAYLKSKYSVATINYFYETNFHEDDSVDKLSNIIKWTYSPKIAIVSKHNIEEMSYVQRAINQVNALDLPIKYTLTDSKDSAAIKVFFGDFEQVRAFLNSDSKSVNDDDPSSSSGTVKATSYDGIMDRANIGIYFAKGDLDSAGRYKVVLEEIIQSLGAGGDSYNYPGSLFFENYNPAKSLTQLDLDVLSLLYESAIPANYTRQAFEKDFSAELYAVNTSKKIKDLLHKKPQYSAADIEKCFTKGVLLKHPKETSIHLLGDVQKEDSVTVAHAILSLNKISPNIKIKLAGVTSREPGFGIFLTFLHNDHQKQIIQRTNEVVMGKDCMLPKLTKNKITLSFRSGNVDAELRRKSIIDALYFSLIPMPQEPSRTNQLFTDNGNFIDFTPRYVNLMKAIYSNEFLDGLKLSDFMKVRSSVVK